jgi:hypothetical protein
VSQCYEQNAGILPSGKLGGRNDKIQKSLDRRM